MHSYEELQWGGAHLVFIVLMLALGEWLSFQSARTGQIELQSFRGLVRLRHGFLKLGY